MPILASSLVLLLGLLGSASDVVDLARHDPERLLAEVEQRLRAGSRDLALHCRRARLLAELGRSEEGLVALRALASDAPGNAEILATIAALEFARGNDVAGLAAVRRARALGVATPAALRAAGRALVRLGRAAEGVELLQAAGTGPGEPTPDAVLQLAGAHVAAGDDEAALGVLDAAIARRGPVMAWFDAALAIERRTGRRAAALARFAALPPELRGARPFVQRRQDLLGSAVVMSSVVAPDAAAPTASPSVLEPRPSPASAVPPVPAELLPFGATWRYFDATTAPPFGWEQPGFDDSAWSSGPAQLGYGDGDEATVLQSGVPGARPMTAWFRRELTIADPTLLVAPRVRLLCDDGAVVYVNGVEIGRWNLHNGAPGPASPASVAVAGADESALHSLPFAPTLLVAGINQIAVEVHQVAPTSSDLSFDLQLVEGLGDVAVVRGPYLQNATPTSIAVCWRTDQPTGTQLWLGASPGSLQVVFSDSTPRLDHRATVGGLVAETAYDYAIGDVAGPFVGTAPATLRTLPPGGAARPLRVWALGDAGIGWAPQYWVRDAFHAFAGTRPADGMLLLGDNAYFTGTDLEYQNGFFDVYGATLRSTCVWSTLGNHDAASATSANDAGVYYDAFVLPRAGEAGGLPSGTEAYYSFDRGHVHFVCLDSMDSDRTATGAMATWLQADLAATTARWIVAFFHHPPYSHGSHDSDVLLDSGGRMTEMREVLLPMLEAGGVDLVLAGHSHDYERSFLLDGHYGVSATLQPSMLLDRGDGRADGDGVYAKPTAGPAAHEGTIYVVAGSAGATGGGALDHPAMQRSSNTLGSLVLDFDGDRLDVTFVGLGGVEDRFTVQKGLVRTLVRNQPRISLANGGRQDFELRAGAAMAGKIYLLAGSSGSEPGLQLGSLHVPLNPDSWLSLSLDLANSSVYPGSIGLLDAQGRGTTALVLPPMNDPTLIGMVFEHAYLVWSGGGFSFASNPVRVTLSP